MPSQNIYLDKNDEDSKIKEEYIENPSQDKVNSNQTVV